VNAQSEYRIQNTEFRMSDSRVAPFLQAVHFFPEIGSTNDEAARLAHDGAPDGTLVLADAQTAGRGRIGRSWFSPAGTGLYASIVFRPSSAWPLLTLAGGVALAEGVRAATGFPVQLKWPNDLMSPGGRKLGGILTEGATAGGVVQFVVFGFGINVRGTRYPRELAERATTLEAEVGKPLDRGPVLVECLAALAARRRDLDAGRSQDICERWLELAPSARDRSVEFTADGLVHRGVTAGIAEDGALLIRTDHSVERVISGEVRWV
jgi:BirA family transcriptional regulator, biotin operon repressor / biotin---[acetyl-CoA-carboxylase] ligase